MFIAQLHTFAACQTFILDYKLAQLQKEVAHPLLAQTPAATPPPAATAPASAPAPPGLTDLVLELTGEGKPAVRKKAAASILALGTAEATDALVTVLGRKNNGETKIIVCEAIAEAQSHLPAFKTPAGESPEEYLRELSYRGLQRRFGDSVTEEHRSRLERELEVIELKQYSSYVLIVHDFVQYAKDSGIPCGARGSGCATLMGYCLGISDVDPMRYGLLFERFTDPQRDEDPDFDIDMCQDGRAQVIQYVQP